MTVFIYANFVEGQVLQKIEKGDIILAWAVVVRESFLEKVQLGLNRILSRHDLSRNVQE